MKTKSFATLMSLMLALGVVALIASDRPDVASAADLLPIDHPSLVPESPEREYPAIVYENVVDQYGRRPQTYAVNLVGNYVISGGNFQQIQLQDGSTIDQPYLSIVDWRTKEQMCTELDVNDEVLSIEPGPRSNTAYIGGRFSKATGADGVERTRNKVALIDLETCAVDRTFSSIGANGKITNLDFTGDRLFVGGDFTQIGGVGQVFVAELDHITGAVKPEFNVSFTSGGLSSPIRTLESNPAGTRLIVAGRFGSVADVFGNSVSETVTSVIDITGTTPVVTPHSFTYPHSEFGDRLWATSFQDADLSPDGTSIALAFGTATVSDYVYLVPTVETATPATWVQYNRDSNFAVAVSNNAVYVAGHFCKVDEGPGTSELLAPNSGPGECTGAGMDGGVWRTQLLALSLSDGTPLNWNPGNDAFRGGAALQVVPRGLLSGFDGMRTNNIMTGTTAFFDFGPPPDPREGQECRASVNDDGSISLSWDSADGINTWSVRRNTQFIETVENSTSYVDAAPKGTHTYYIRSTFNGAQLDTECNPTVTTDGPPAQTCQAALNPETGEVTITWDENNGATSYNVRRNTRWLAATSDFTYTDVPLSGTHLYVIRSTVNGQQTNTNCDPEITTEGPPPQTCTVSDGGAGDVLIQFTPVFGEDTYAIRRDGSFVGETTNLNYTDTPGEGTYTYSVRSRLKGRTTETTCEPSITIGDPPPPPEAYQTCVATENPDGSVTLLWSAIAGESSYSIALDGVFLTTVDDTNTWTAPEATPGAIFEIRSRQNVVSTSTPCVVQPTNGCALIIDDDRVHLAFATFNNEDRSFDILRNGSAVGSVNLGSTLVFTGDHNTGDTWEVYSAVKRDKVTISCTE